MDKIITIVGTGMDGADTLTAEGLEAIKNADVLIGAERMIKPFEAYKKPFFLSYMSKNIAEYIIKCRYSKIAVLMSGDCGFYSGAEKLLPLLDDYETKVICGLSSPIYFCSRLKIPWQGMRMISLHGRNSCIVRNVCRNRYTFFLLGGGFSPSDICQRLCGYGKENLTVYIGENLSCPNEHIRSGMAKDFTDIKTDKLAVMIVENPDYERYIRSCIPDDEFIRGKVPMTKAEVRNVCVSKLEIGEESICWDIGSGTGSVSIEMAMCCDGGKVYAVDKNFEAVMLTQQNCRKFGCDNVEFICGYAEAAAENFPAPDSVFIGGSCGELTTICKSAARKKPQVKIVITAVSLETLHESVFALDEIGFNAEITQLAVTRTKKIGSHTMLSAENPVYIIVGRAK